MPKRTHLAICWRLWLPRPPFFSHSLEFFAGYSLCSGWTWGTSSFGGTPDTGMSPWIAAVMRGFIWSGGLNPCNWNSNSAAFLKFLKTYPNKALAPIPEPRHSTHAPLHHTRASFSVLSSSMSRGAQAARIASSSLGLRHANSRVALGAADRVVDGLRRAQSQHERRCTQLQREVVRLSQNIRKNNERLERARALLERPLGSDGDGDGDGGAGAASGASGASFRSFSSFQGSRSFQSFQGAQGSQSV